MTDVGGPGASRPGTGMTGADRSDDRAVDELADLIDDAELIADVNGSLDAAAAQRLAVRLERDGALRARRARIAALAGAVTDPLDAQRPAFGDLRGPWQTGASATPVTAGWDAPSAPEPAPVSPRLEPPPAKPGLEPAPVASHVEPVPVLPLLTRTARRRRPVLAAAAALVLLVGALVAVRTGVVGRDVAPVTASVLTATPGEVLELASDATVEARTARIDIRGDAEVAFRPPLLGRPGERTVVGIRLAGDGAVRFGVDGDPGATDYRMRTSFVGVSGPPSAQPALTVSETIRVAGRTYESDDGVVFEESDGGGSPGLFGLLVLEPDVLGRLDDLVDGQIRDLGVEELGGVDHRRLAFTASSELFPESTHAPAEIEVWVSSADHTVSRFVMRIDGPLDEDELPDAELRFEATLEVTDLGVDLEIMPPN